MVGMSGGDQTAVPYPCVGQLTWPLTNRNHPPATLQSLTQLVEAVLPKHEVTVREPDPVGARLARSDVAADRSTEEPLTRERSPIPGDPWYIDATEILKQLDRLRVLLAVEDGHRDLELRGSVMNQGAQLVDEEVRVLPAVADDLERQAPSLRSALFEARKGRQEPARRDSSSRCKAQKEQVQEPCYRPHNPRSRLPFSLHMALLPPETAQANQRDGFFTARR